jgi:carbamoyl-phosphate synthase large subunit
MRCSPPSAARRPESLCGLAEAGVLDKYGVELIGAKIDAIKKAEDRLLFKDAMRKIGLETPQSQLVNNVEGGLAFAESHRISGDPAASFTLGGIGRRHRLQPRRSDRNSGARPRSFARARSADRRERARLEGIRAGGDARSRRQRIIVCSIENFDPMGVHTGDSITVAPAQTLTDREYQMMRDGALRCLREIGVDTGGSNVQFAINPQDGRMVIIEMNPRVSRSSALASKATGFPIAKIAAKLAVGYRLDEIRTTSHARRRPAFEPTIDYVVVKIPAGSSRNFPAPNHAGHADEIGRRSDGHRPHFPASAVPKACAAWKPASLRLGKFSIQL